MKVLVIFAHPLPESYNAALHAAVVRSLTEAGHTVDDLDLYAEEFTPVLTAAERRRYHDLSVNREPVAGYVDRLIAAEGVVFVYPTWCFGVPAILKGWFDRVLLPGVSFTLGEDGIARPALRNIRRVAAVATYGRPWWLVRLIVGDLPRYTVCNYFRRLCAPGTRATYLAHYDMNRSTPATRARFLDRVSKAMAAL